MTRSVLYSLALILVATSANAATLTGRVVNGTTGEPGRADRIEIFDVTKTATGPVAFVEDVDGEFTLADLPDAAAAHFRLVVTAGDLELRQAVESFDVPMDVFVYESTDQISDVVLLRHHVIFTRDPEHMQVTEFFEFDNRTDPPRIISASARAMRMELDHDIHGAPTASLMGGAVPVDVPVGPTDEAGISAVDYQLQPGPTRLVVRYLVHEENQELAWATRSIYPTEERRLLVSPADVSVDAAGMISTESTIEGYAAYAGLASAPDDAWVVSLSGGSAGAVADGHDHEAETAQVGAYTEIVARPNRLTESRTMILALLGGVLVFATLLALRNGPKPALQGGPRDESRMAVSKMADRYVSGEISREEYEREAARILKKTPGRDTAHVG